jgi:tRNA A-37 threonylcarbamoyl transferase component Bud32
VRSSELDWARRLRDLLTGPDAGGPGDAPRLARYEARDRLGEGATAVVYRAWDRQLHRPVALKVLRDLAGLSQVARERFHREAQAAAGLSHPNVVTIYDAGEHDGRLFLVMELVEGRALDEVLREAARDERAIAELLEKTARGVAAAHEKGIVHRDLKPLNVLVTAGGEPKVGDFGLAHLVDSGADLTRTGTQLGTPLYMAPEQVEGRAGEITPRTDVYGLGAMLYEALTGRPPHGGQTIHEIYGNIVRREPVPPRSLNARISRDLQTIALKALEKSPRGRYATAAELADDLRRFLQGEPIRARPVPTAVRLWRRAVKARAVLLPSAAAAVLAAALGLWAARSAVEGRRKLEDALARAGQAERDEAWEDAYAGHQVVLELDPSNRPARERLERIGEILRNQREAQAALAQAQDALVRAREVPPPEPQPEGDVILREDFENYSNRKGWAEYGTTENAIAIVDGGHDGGKCLQLTTRPQFLKEAAYLYKRLPVGLDVCHVRYYVRYSKPPTHQIRHGLFLLANHPPTTWPQVRENQKAQGDKWFMTGVDAGEDRRAVPLPGAFRVMSNWFDSPKPREDAFRPKKVVPVPVDRWVCVELMVRCNQPGRADGEQALWIDGQEVGRWTQIRWRSDERVQVNGVWMLIYFGYVGEPSATDYSKYVTSIRFDDVVISRRSIGPAGK